MAKDKTLFTCSDCTAPARRAGWMSARAVGPGTRWLKRGRDAGCGQEPLLSVAKSQPVATSGSRRQLSAPLRAWKSWTAVTPAAGISQQRVVLIGGDGHRQSTLLLQALALLRQPRCCTKRRESGHGVALRAARAAARRPGPQLLPEINLSASRHPARRQARTWRWSTLIQTRSFRNLGSAPGSVAQVRECAAQLTRFARPRHHADHGRPRHQGTTARWLAQRAGRHVDNGAVLRGRHPLQLPPGSRVIKTASAPSMSRRLRDDREGPQGVTSERDFSFDPREPIARQYCAGDAGRHAAAAGWNYRPWWTVAVSARDGCRWAWTGPAGHAAGNPAPPLPGWPPATRTCSSTPWATCASSEPAADLAVLLAIQSSLRRRRFAAWLSPCDEVGPGRRVRPAPRAEQAKLGFGVTVPRLAMKPIESDAAASVDRIEIASRFCGAGLIESRERPLRRKSLSIRRASSWSRSCPVLELRQHVRTDARCQHDADSLPGWVFKPVTFGRDPQAVLNLGDGGIRLMTSPMEPLEDGRYGSCCCCSAGRRRTNDDSGVLSMPSSSAPGRARPTPHGHRAACASSPPTRRPEKFLREHQRALENWPVGALRAAQSRWLTRLPRTAVWAAARSHALYAVIFTNQRTAVDAGYGTTAATWSGSPHSSPATSGRKRARVADGLGITVSYWASEAGIAAWRRNAEHQIARHRPARLVCHYTLPRRQG